MAEPGQAPDFGSGMTWVRILPAVLDILAKPWELVMSNSSKTKMVVGAVGMAASLWVFGFAGTLALGAAFGAGALWASDSSGRYVEQAKERAQIAADDN